jgi:ubiquinone biosynthesis accessory factor UbiJ
MTATPAWLAAFEALLNRGVQASMQATALARRLGGTALHLDIEGMASIRISVLGGRLSLIGAAPPDSQAGEPGAHAADATLAGSPLALLRLAGGSAPRGAGVSGGAGVSRGAGVSVSGDAEIANAYRELLALARPDFEEELSRLVGDVPARALSQFAAKTVEWAARAHHTAGENIAEYLQEESRDLVNKPELDEFLQGVDMVRETADRVDARIARLEQRLKGRA